MSYRDLRNFTEMLHELGYPRLISMENFRTPNFPLVAEILIWLVQRFDPDVDVALEISTESERVALIRSVTQFLVLKGNIKLNTKKLYQADGYAVKEMLKVASLLYDSLKATETNNNETDDIPEVSVVSAALKAQELKQVTQSVRDIVSSGASLFELLAVEGELRELRNNSACRHIEMTQVEQAVKDSIVGISAEMDNTKESIKNILSNETTLNTKIEKRKSDLERHIKRLQTLKKIRPAFMEEFEKLEEDLKKLYKDYIIKCRNISYLENILEQTELTERKRIDQKQAITRKLIEELKQEELSVQSGDIFSEAIEENPKTNIKKRENMRRKTATGKDLNESSQNPGEGFGNMTGDINNSDSLEDSDSDLLLDGDITEDEDIEIDNQPIREFSDDDF